MTNWTKYYQAVGDKPNTLAMQALTFYVPRQRKDALDLGAGNFRDSLLLKAEGFERVVAVDSFKDVPEVPAGIEFHRMPIEDYVMGSVGFDVIVCCNTLFFLSKEKVVQLFKQIRLALRSGGVFACNFLGERDDWVGREGMSWFTLDEAQCLGHQLRGFIEDDLGEVEYDGYTTGDTPKHWHLRSLLYQKS